MSITALIPARGGSKGIKRKNLVDLGGRPLIGWTIEAALNCGRFERVVVSTDDEEIAEVAIRLGATAPFLRPAEYAGDLAPAVQVIRHALDFFLDQRGGRIEAIAYLQPTSPFRTSAHLLEAISLFEQYRPATLVSVVKVPHSMTEGSLMTPLHPTGPLWLEPPSSQLLRRQEKPVAYARNGPAILFVSADEFLQSGRLYGNGVLGFEMDRLSSHDIDDELDLEMARALLPLVHRLQGRD